MNVELRLRNVSKRYGRIHVLDDVGFTCPPGTITAFCGPNGAGKSTALRVLTGVARPDTGTALVNGRCFLDLDEPARVVGALLDASAFHPGRTVRETLRLGAFTIAVPTSRADDCAELVGLGPVTRRRVGQLSMGMRQRLGLAHALLGSPSALVLDEPSNGLDPEGIAWLSRLLRQFAERGGTVLVSTHHLAALERTADRLVVMSRGRIVAETSIADVRSSGTVVRPDHPRFAPALRRVGGRPERRAGQVRVDLDPATVGRVARDEGIALTELRADDQGVDEFLARVTTGAHSGRAL